ncbi:MAG: phosphopantetheine-binding protein, partial [Cyanobacteria bacterium P01_A01_bin.114]
MTSIDILERATWSAYANQPARTQTAIKFVPELRRFLQAQLPDYMVPSTFVVMPDFPLTPNGKVDRRALPEPPRVRIQSEAAFASPRTPLEAQIADLWAATLSLEQVGIDDNFFDLGGHSLLAAELMFRLQEQFDVKLALINLFMSPTENALRYTFLKAFLISNKKLFKKRKSTFSLGLVSR